MHTHTTFRGTEVFRRAWSAIRFPLVLTLLLTVVLLGNVPTASRAEAPAVEGFAFTAVGDYNSTANTTANLAAIPSDSEFHLALGDLSYGSPAPESAWCSYVQSSLVHGTPVDLVSGNHDMDNQPTGHINNFAACLPHSSGLGTVNGTYGKEYYFDYAGAPNLARIIMISPNLNLDGELYTYSVGSARYNWLASAIDGARAAGIKWIIVGMHKNCISIGQKTCEIGSDLMNLLVTKKVDLVLQGHDHNYQRSKQLQVNAVCTAIVPGTYDPACVSDDGADHYYRKGKGTVVVIVGTGGTSLYPVNKSDSEAGYFAAAQGAGIGQRYGFLYVNLQKGQMDVRFYPSTGDSNFADSFRIGKGAAVPGSVLPKAPNWKYLDDGSDQTLTGWQEPGFDDSTWAEGPAQLGYGDGDEATVVSYGPVDANKYVTTYFRNTFSLPSAAAGYTGLKLGLVRDDGAIVYLNGHEVARSNMAWGAVDYQTLASTTIGDMKESKFFKYFIDPAYLQDGLNTLAVEIHQADVTSSDISFDLKLDGFCGAKPQKPKLVSPSDGETTTNLLVGLDWEDSTSQCATLFDVEVRDGSETGPIVAGINDWPTSDFTPADGTFVVGHTYYWQVTGCSTKCKKSAWWSFSVAAE